ncbi:hypothetical protein JCM18904_3264 [Vibrio sp. JCM 18904]|nr:hypothetical protein JCM18904_3264 [Vibrio sp. JCM 18904]
MDNIEKELYQAAIELVNMRYPSGWGGAAAVRTESGKILTSIAPDTKKRCTFTMHGSGSVFRGSQTQ